MKKIYIGADHAGFELKEKLKPFLQGLGYEVEDKGALSLDQGDDYPNFIFPVAEAVARDNYDNYNNDKNSSGLMMDSKTDSKGIIIGLSGQGEAMTANRVKGIRAAVYYGVNLEIIRLSREHNDANILSFGAKFLTENQAKEALSLWLSTAFSGDSRHIRRIHKMDVVQS